jgi:hypothetical protein
VELAGGDDHRRASALRIEGGGGGTVTAGPSTTAGETRRRPSPTARRGGYLLSAVVNLVLLWLLLVEPGWRWLGFLTEDFTAVMGWLTLSLVVGVAVNLAFIGFDPPWARRLGDALSAGVASVAMARLWSVFPFDLGTWSGWQTALRVALGVACIATAIGAVANLVEAFRLGRAAV